ncbi:hypothetical protein F5J12DRAFT_940273 [Pisolithus orientalis]|uniref:uncharacterized protein n=1 Tax=Pisolithus orientalis TaxID=936130 RepID=UPI00222419DC|nr:uncharacterized protein F5J12DRAFT_940273 [Pisolithus orientalis]KAI6006346.1 hypothetical protein F5J12DRAFT_940273 [Pisolithus orientalis]
MTPTIMVKMTVLKIQVHDINFMYDATGTTTGMSITLPFHKTHQTGDIKPYFLWVFHQLEAHLCTVRATSEWIIASNIMSSYLFHKIASGDHVAEANIPMLMALTLFSREAASTSTSSNNGL